MMHNDNNKDTWIDYLLDERDENRLLTVVTDMNREKFEHMKKMYEKRSYNLCLALVFKPKVS